jgi:hypothetical protein
MSLNEPYEPHRVHWWGEPWPKASWRASVCEDDRYRIDVPVGEICCLCHEQIAIGDRGVRYTGSVVMVDGEPAAGPIPYSHAECNLRSVTGSLAHISDGCTHVGQCYDSASAQTYREEARQVWAELLNGTGLA